MFAVLVLLVFQYACRIRITASDHPAGHPYAGKLIAYLYGNKLVSDW
jgi:hypothetical protein